MSESILTLSGREAVRMALQGQGVNVDFIPAGEIRKQSSRLFQMLRQSTPGVIVIEAPSVEALDVMALRWVFPGGVTPLVLCPSNVPECAELAQAAVTAASLLKAPVFLLLDQQLADQIESMDDTAEYPELSYVDEPAPLDALELPEPEILFRELESRLSRIPTGLNRSELDACPASLGKPEWLVIAYGATRGAAREAVQQAREEGQRVSLLNLNLLWPVPEPDLLRAGMGIKHVVVAERNMGQYAQEVRRVLPELPVIPAGTLSGPVPSDLILRRLQRSPRCC